MSCSTNCRSCDCDVQTMKVASTFLFCLPLNNFVLCAARVTRLFSMNVAHLVDTRMDPLVNPESCSSHVHSVFGSADFSKKLARNMFIDEEWEDLTGKENQTTSNIIPNLSMYWVPSLYILQGGIHYKVPSFGRPYYRITHGTDENRGHINPFPPYLRMIVGGASRMTHLGDCSTNPDRDDIRWTLRTFNRGSTNKCDNGDWKYLETEPYLAEINQAEMNVNFPECLELKNNNNPRLRSSNYRDHLAYPLSSYNEETGNWCPTSHPYQIPRLNLEVRYELDKMRPILGAAVVDNVLNWRFSTGDATGGGGHADFVSGWPEDLMRNFIQNCTKGVDHEGGNCLVSTYLDNGRNLKTIPYTKMVPNETIDEIAVLPTGECPEFVPYAPPV